MLRPRGTTSSDIQNEIETKVDLIFPYSGTLKNILISIADSMHIRLVRHMQQSRLPMVLLADGSNDIGKLVLIFAICMIICFSLRSNNRTASIKNIHNGKLDFIWLAKKDNLILFN